MKKNIALLFFSLFIFNSSPQEKSVRGASPYGFFADFLWALNHLEYCEATNKTPVIYWGKEFAYYSPKGYNESYNGWEYYFEPVSELSYIRGDFLYTSEYYKRENNFSTLWWYTQYIDNKHLLTPEEKKTFISIEDHENKYIHGFKEQKKLAYPVGKYHLYSKDFREWVNKNIIAPFIKIKPCILTKIYDFYRNNFKKRTIGIHLRGGHIGKEVLPVPLSYIFEEANKHANMNVQFFIATDQQPLLEAAQKKLNSPVIYYPCERFNKTTSPYPGKKLNPKLGEDLLIEMMLLSQCDHLIHTLSNVSTAALYFNPNLEHTLIY